MKINDISEYSLADKRYLSETVIYKAIEDRITRTNNVRNNVIQHTQSLSHVIQAVILARHDQSLQQLQEVLLYEQDEECHQFILDCGEGDFLQMLLQVYHIYDWPIEYKVKNTWISRLESWL